MVEIIFVSSLLVTFVIARFVAHVLHDRQNYGTPYEMSRTVTGLLRKKTGFNWHHYHFGIIILILVFVFNSFFGFQGWIIIFSGIGISLFLDQINFLVYSKGDYFEREYFSLRSFLISFMFHIIFVLFFIFFSFG